MSVRYFEILRDSSRKGNYIPSGRQLPRTPPLSGVKRHLDFSDDDSTVGCEEPQHSTEAGTRDQDDQDGTFDFNAQDTKREPDNTSSMLKRMKGYQLTAGDLEFIKRMKEEKLVKKYQGDLEEVQRLLKKETMALKFACASKETAQVELNKFPSCEELREWVKVVLKMTLALTELTDLDTKSLLAMVTKENIQTTVEEKMIRLAQMEMMMAEKRKKEAEERGQWEKQIANEQLKIQRLMSQLSDLTCELAQQEEAHKALQVQIKTREENQVEAEEADASQEQQTAKSKVKRRRKEGKKAVHFSEKLLDTTNQSKPTRGKRTLNSKTDNETIVKDDHANESTGETLETSTEEQTKRAGAAAERLAKSVKTARRPQKAVEEQESNSQDSVQAVRERRMPPETTRKIKSMEVRSTSQQVAPSHSRKKTAVSAEEAQSSGLRRSRRIANRR